MPKIDYKIEKFKGLKRDTSRWKTGFDYSYEIINGYANGTDIIQRNGTLPTCSQIADYPVTFQYEVLWDNGTSDEIARCGTSWWRKGEDGEFTEITGLTGRTLNAKGQAVMWQGYLIIIDGDTVKKVTLTDGEFVVSAVSADTNQPQKPTAAHVHASRLWFNDVNNEDTSLRMTIHGSKIASATNDTSWTQGSGDKVTIDLSESIDEYDPPTGFISISNSLLVIQCLNNIVIYNAPQVYSEITWANNMDVGILSPGSGARVGKDYIYPSHTGFKNLASTVIYNQLSIKDLTSSISPLYNEYVEAETDLSTVSGVYYEELDHYYVTFPTSNVTLVYSIELKNIVGVFKFNFTPYSWLKKKDGTILIGDGEGVIHKYSEDYFTDNGDTIQFEFTPPYMGIDYPNRFKTLKLSESMFYCDILSDSDATCTVYYQYFFAFVDYVEYSTQKKLTVTPTDSDKLFQVRDNTIRGRGKLMGITISNYDKRSGGDSVDTSINTRLTFTYFMLSASLGGTK